MFATDGSMSSDKESIAHTFNEYEASKFDHSLWIAMSPLTLLELTFPL